MTSGPPDSLVVRNIDVLVTMDDDRRVLTNAWILVRGNVIEALGNANNKPPDAAHTIDATGKIVIPGLINTHHHFFQSLLRAVPSLQNRSLWYWLLELYRPMASLTDEMNDVSTRLVIAELLLSGCTTAQDHSYVFVNDMAFETQINAASEMGMRFHLSRGSITVGRADGSIAEDDLVEDEEKVLAHCEHLAKSFHDPTPGAMTRIDLAPVSLFSNSPWLLQESAALARKLDLGLHTHCYESQEEEDYCLEVHGARPVQFAADNGWTGPDVWFAHAVRHDTQEVKLMGLTGTGVAHCPSSNMRLASGIAPVKEYLEQGVRVGLGCDGSASNDSSHLLAEARTAMLLQRVKHGANAMTATQALELGTLGGAKVLRRDDIGMLAPRKVADFVAFDLNQPSFAGALHDPVAALIFCQPSRVDLSVINGKVVVDDGQILGLDLRALVDHHNLLAGQLIEATEARFGHDLSTKVWHQAWR
jgi:cytosine/adenosine deaminase-related metal-dependent hydrolase|tara:strand:+ start:6736 stop:8160 length:1425 start_codon:yes stop_codon:yes gene_type:complete